MSANDRFRAPRPSTRPLRRCYYWGFGVALRWNVIWADLNFTTQAPCHRRSSRPFRHLLRHEAVGIEAQTHRYRVIAMTGRRSDGARSAPHHNLITVGTVV